MTKSVFILNLSKEAFSELRPYIEEAISADCRTIMTKARTGDSVNTVSVITAYLFELLQNKEVCYTMAAIFAAWVRSKNNKSITIKKDGYTIEAKNLNEKQLYKIFSETKTELKIEEKD
ncbi:hypothetical protein [Kosakonia oryziphila]|uniref:hypothetical protein n=1 Tax=Kosakonia oryziphila TaxID=1005667 RepID=UPI001112988C|nr:hypothetical protein [Kosakonia oryziphila]